MVNYRRLLSRLMRGLSDEQYLKLQYFYHFHTFPNLKNPISYNEKLQWLKLYDHNPLYPTIVDKLEMKKWLISVVGEGYTVPTLGAWNSPDEIDFNSLPNQFVLKWNHDSGSIVLCKDKSKFDIELAKLKLQHGYKVNGYWYGREWPYLNVPPKVFAEPYLEDTTTHELRDYKVFTFDGEVKLLLIATERQKEGVDTKFDFFDPQLNHLDLVNQHANAITTPEPPRSFPLMKELAEKISKNFKHLRVDFYEVNGKVYVGELTLYHGSGFMTFSPSKWYNTLGNWINLEGVK